jgi:hypothetical protein
LQSEDSYETKRERWRVRHENLFLRAIMKELAGSAHISFEGDLSGCKFSEMAGATFTPTAVLERNTFSPMQDFVIVPLEPSTEHAIMASIGGSIPESIIHILIEKQGRLEFAAYDNFHPECIYLGSAVRPEFIDEMLSQRLLNRLSAPD